MLFFNLVRSTTNALEFRDSLAKLIRNVVHNAYGASCAAVVHLAYTLDNP